MEVNQMTMTKDEALKLALSTLNEVRQETFRLMRDGQTFYAEDKVWSTIISIKEVLAQPEHDNIYGYASSLATAMREQIHTGLQIRREYARPC